MNHPESFVKIQKYDNLLGIYPKLHNLLDICYPKHPKDVFYRFIEQYRIGFPVYLAVNQGSQVVGFVYLAPNSKGGTLESLAVHPEFRGLKLGQSLVKKLLSENTGVIQITTRVPEFFEKLSFQRVTQLPDKSYFMINLNF